MTTFIDSVPRPTGEKPVVLIAGPTASGKSARALDLAMREGGVIINADSMQIYDALPLLTAQPSADEVSQAPHALYGALHPTDVCSVAQWVQLAEAEILAAWSAGQLPIIVGGTGLYFKALTQGLAPVPDVDPVIRADVRALLKAEGPLALKAALRPLDPVLAAQLEDGDGQRLARALEVARSTGTPLSTWQAAPPAPSLLQSRSIGAAAYVVEMERSALYARCDARLAQMIQTGALQQIEAFLGDESLLPSPLEKCVGFPPLRAHLDGLLTLEAALEQAQRDTRRYAKRQMTWMRNQFEKWERLNTQ